MRDSPNNMKIKDAILQTDYYPTAEYALAVTLLYFNVPLISLEHDSPASERLIFLFDHSPELNQIVQDFWNDSLQCSPKKWHSLSRELKSRIRAELAFQRR